MLHILGIRDPNLELKFGISDEKIYLVTTLNRRLRQTLVQRVQLENESVADYAKSLRKLYARLSLARTEWMHKFVFSLKKEIREYIILQQPDDLQKAEELALLKEAVMDEKLCFSKEVAAFEAKDISVQVAQALERLELLTRDRSGADNVLSANASKIAYGANDRAIPSQLNQLFKFFGRV